MRVAFIRPKPSPSTIGLQHMMVVEPLELEILATLITPEHKVIIYDMILEAGNIEDLIKQFNPDVLCLTGYITHIDVIVQCCKIAKQINKNHTTIVGGVHIEKFPEDINDESIDYRVVRNATRSFPQLIDYIKGNSSFPLGILKTNELLREELLPDYDFFVPIPNRSFTSKYRSDYFYVFHNKVALIKTSFGCPYTCRFCFCRKITDDKYHERPIYDVIKELETIQEKEIYIVDDDFLLNPNRIREFIRLLKEKKLQKRFLVYGRADFIVSHPDIIKDFKLCGLRTIIVGLESFEDNELKGFDKKTTLSINEQAIVVLNKYKVDCYAAVIVSPSWSQADFEKAGMIMRRLKIKFVNLQPLTPLKGTGIDISDDLLVINRNDFARWDLAHITIKPEKMSVGDFYKNILKLYDEIIFNPRNLISHLKYPIHMQWRMVIGLNKVRNQYKKRIMEAARYE